MNAHAVAWLVPALPLFGALALALPRSERIATSLTIACSALAFGLSVIVMAAVRSTGTLVLVTNWVQVDALSVLLLLLITFVSTTAAVFSAGYVGPEYGAQRTRLYYANFNLFVFSMLSIPFIVEFGLVWIAVELTTLLSVLLVSFAATREALEAAWKYMVLTLLGATVAVLGVLILFWALHFTGSIDFTWAGLRAGAASMPLSLVKVAFALILVGYGAKIGLVPLHTWLPDAHSQAPAPVCALLSGVETTVVLYVLLRLRGVFLAVPAVHVQAWFAVLGLISVGAAVLLIMQTHDFKRLFAFSTVEHMGIILVAASFATPLGDVSAVWQIMTHAVTKSLCFYAAGSALLVTGTRSIADVTGLLGRSKVTAAALLMGALAISGAPPFAVFLSELAIFRAGIVSHHYLVTGLLAAFVVAGFFGMLFQVTKMIFGRPAKSGRAWPPLPVPCAIALGIAALPVIALGVWVPLSLIELLMRSAAALGG